MSRLTLSYEDLYNKIGRFLGWGVPTDKQLRIVKDIIDRGYRQFLYPTDLRNGELHEWNFLKQYWAFSTIGDKWRYALPNDFSDLLDDFHYDTGTGYPHLEKRSAEQIKQLQADAQEKAYPEYYAITPSKYDLEIGTVYELWMYPTPNQAYRLATFYRIDPLKPSVTTDLMVGGIRATEAILESCLAVAETQEDGIAGLHTQLANNLIQKLIVADTVADTDKIGNLYQDKGRIWPRERDLLTDIPTGNIYSAQR